MNPRLSLENHQWNVAKSGGKEKLFPIFQTFHNKKKLFDLFDELRQQLIEYKTLISQYDLKNHQDWVDDIFAILVNIDNIIIKYETARESGDNYGITIYDTLKEEADMLDEISGMPNLQLPERGDDVDEKIENQYLLVRKAIYAVHTALLETIPR
jgi:hypothetical protein